MDAKFINPFLEATKSCIEMMAMTPVSAGTPAIKQGTKTWGVVTGVIGMAGDDINGNLVLSFDSPAILAIVERMLGESFEEVNDEIVDAVGELTNMICAGAKKSLGEEGFQIEMALPMVIKGQDIEMTQLTNAPVISIPFETDEGKFVVEASLKSKNN